jgi:myo-inositol-1(or 4)-monophosphatase
MQYNSFLKLAIISAEKSGDLIISYFQKLKAIRKKNKNLRDLISEVDILSENEILSTLKSKFKKHNFLAEESGYENNHSDFTWIVDPLDGTVNYIKGIKLCAISIALTYKKETIVGVIYNPFSKELYYSSKNGGSYLNGNPIQVSKNKNLANCLLVSAFSSKINLKKKNKEYKDFGNLNNKSLGVLRIGSAALAMAMVAKGSIDGIWGYDLKIWDIEAGICLIREAQGKVLEKKIGTNKTIIAGNSYVVKLLKNNLN